MPRTTESDREVSRLLRRVRSPWWPAFPGSRIRRIRWTALLLLVAAWPTVLPADSDAPPGELPQLSLAIALDPENQGLAGSLELQRPPEAIDFTLLPGLRLTEAAIDDHRPVTWTQEGNGYSMQLPAGTQVLHLNWEGRLEATQGRILFGPPGGFLPGASGWYPHPRQLGDFAASTRLTMPPGQLATATGSRVSDPTRGAEAGSDTVLLFEHPRTNRVEVATGPWVERSRTVGGVRLVTLFPEDLSERLSDTYLDHLTEYLPAFVERSGPYPFSSFTVAASPLPVGLAFPGWTLMGEVVLALPFIPQTSLAHEFKHSWWGTGVRVDHASGNWSEGLTTYMADYFMDERLGRDLATRERWMLDLAWLADARDHPLRDFQSGNQGTGRMIGYNRAAMVFHMLRQRVGDEAFFSATRLLNARHRHRVARWEDLAEVFSEASGQDIGAFLAPWLERSGLPEIGWRGLRVERADQGAVLVGELVQTGAGEPWPLQVPLVLQTTEGVVRHRVELADRSVGFRLPLGGRLESVDLDPEFDVLRAWPDPPPTARSVILDPAARYLATEAGLDAVIGQVFRDGEATALGDPADFRPDAPTLLIGRTAEVDDLQARLGLRAPILSLQTEGSARMWTVPGTRSLLISGDDVAAIERLVRALRHQGHRSYLVQDGRGRTVASGVWDSGIRHLRWMPEGS